MIQILKKFQYLRKRYSTVSIKQQQYPQSQFQTPKTIVHLLYNLLDHHLYVVMDR